MLDRISDPNELSPCLGEGDGVTVKMLNTKRRVVLDVLMACWGLSPWLGVNGFFVQLPLLVEQLPEQWALPSAMTVAVQVANIGLLLYAALHRLFPRLSDSLCILALLLTATLSIFINAFAYSVTAVIGGSERSVAFLSMTFFSGLVGCTSSVLFYPYLRHYRDIYLTTYLVGEGLSGFIPSALSLVQGAGGEPVCMPSSEDNSTLVPLQPPPLFGPTTYMLVLGGLAVASLLSFVLIDSGRLFESERVSTVARNKDEEAVRPLSLMSARWVALLVLAACLNVVAIGVMPSIQSYSCRPYGVRAYHLSTALSTMANPLACLAGVWLAPARPRLLAAALTVAALPFGYILATALLRPPPLLDHPSGEVIVVLCWVVVSAVLSYARMWTLEHGRRGGARGMRGCGVASQLGSAGGSLAMFLLISNTSIFVQAPVCPQPL